MVSEDAQDKAAFPGDPPPRGLRIAVVIEDLNQRGGQERVVTELCRRWAQRHEVVIFCFTAEGLDDEPLTIRRLWLPLRRHAFQSLWMLPASRWALRPRRYDVVLSQGGNCLVQNFVLAHTCHARRRVEATQAPGKVGPLRERWLRLRNRWAVAMERRAIRRCPGRLIAVFPPLARMLSEEYGVPLEQILVTYNGVDTEVFHPRNRTAWRSAMRQELGLSEEDVVLIFVGGLWLEKGLTQTIQALGKMQHPARLLVLGQGDERLLGRIAEEAGVRDRVCFLGRREHVERYLAAADVFALPWPIGGWMLLAVTEAAASGLPLVISSLLNPADNYFRDGESAFLVGRDPAEMAERLDRLAANPTLREQMGAQAREAVLPLGWDQQAQAIEQFFLEKTASRAGRAS